jgi:hypothetical protein
MAQFKWGRAMQMRMQIAHANADAKTASANSKQQYCTLHLELKIAGWLCVWMFEFKPRGASA